MPSPLASPPALANFAGHPRRPMGLLALAALSALLAGCQSTPLPAWTPGGASAPGTAQQAVRPARMAPAPTVPPATRARVLPAAPPVVDITPPGVLVMPVRPRDDVPPAPPPEPSPAPSSALPYGAAVAARFTEPTMRYATPGLAEGRIAFTTNAEVRSWLRNLSDASVRGGDVRAAVINYGGSQRGEPLEALLLTRSGNSVASTLLAEGRPTVMLLAQQHGDEPAGAEALLVIAREASQGLLQSLLARINILIVPRPNPDGAAAGTAALANGLDLDRDHLLLRSPEARALARLLRDYRPAVLADAQEYPVLPAYAERFGAVQRADALLQYTTVPNQPEFVTKADEEWFRRPLAASLDRQGLTHEWWFAAAADPAARALWTGGPWPGSARNTEGLKNRVSLVIASRGANLGRQNLQRRVHTQVTALASVLQGTATRADELKQLHDFVERDVSSLACRADAVVEAAPTVQRRTVTLLDAATGADRAVEVEWNSTQQLRALRSRKRPCGYWLDASQQPAAERLRDAGVQVLRVAEPSSLLMDSYRETGRREDASTGATQVDVAISRSLVDVAAGGFYVPLSQPLGNLVFAALEPDAPQGFFAQHLIDRLDAVGRVANVPTLRLEEPLF